MDENEVKIVLRDPIKLEPELDRLLTLFHSGSIDTPEIEDCEDILQGYITPNNRLRKITTRFRKRPQYSLSYKQRLPNHHNIDLTGMIEGDDFDHAWQYTDIRLAKRRYKIVADPVRWDIDFYRWSLAYFALAEVEMPSDLDTWETPAFLVPYVHHIVPRDDPRFAARLLADESHVRVLAKELGLDLN